MKVFLIINAHASSVTPRARVVIQRALSHEHEVQAAETSSRDHATRLAQGAAADGADIVVVMGGDGTLNEAANGLAGTNTALGCLPGGSTNVFARTIGMTNDPIDATAELLESMSAGNKRRIGLGKVQERYFLFNVGIGFDAAVVEFVEGRSSLKRYAGHPLFVASTVLTWTRFTGRKKSHFTADFGTEGSATGSFSIVMNTNPYSFLGNRPLNIQPDLSLEDGLSIVTVKSMSLPAMVGIVGSALRDGRHLRRGRATDFRSNLEHFDVTSDTPFPYQVDGDFLGYVHSLTLRHEPKVLDVFFPV